MSAATAAAHQLLLAEVGDTPDGLLAGLEAPLWAAEAALAGTPAVQYQAVKVRAYNVLITYWRDQMSRTLDEDTRKTLDLRLSTLEDQRNRAVSEQTILRQTGGGGVAVLPLTTTAPITPAAGVRDGNDVRYLGVPYRNGGRP